MSDLDQRVESVMLRGPWVLAMHVLMVALCLLEVSVRLVDDPKASFGQCVTAAFFTYILLLVPVRALIRSLIRTTLAREPT